MFSTIGRRAVSRAAARLYTSHFALPEEHKMVYDMCRKFADEVLAPSAGEWDKKHVFPKEAVAQLVRSSEQEMPLLCDYCSLWRASSPSCFLIAATTTIMARTVIASLAHPPHFNRRRNLV
jgi:hypothetical protein